MTTDQSRPAMSDAEKVKAVEALSKQLLSCALQATNAGVALDALVTAYINCASHLGTLDQVPAAASAMSEASVRILNVQRQLGQGRMGTAIH
ncbi:hypothetical protein QRO08_03640 [Paracidovorax citrulli]|uniref:Uncharacterized protein n=2 Tax=Paracidovorax citrulli TaxID=80869 RepID=A1TUM8_PARC0|nr:hypothetical protein [Paracidovorax citrulli]ABM34666.1 hypothetical protein Aave_4125 [Paracidovorax citrulli AAC00-1]ATG96752.1 hypothetical protein CQB05_24305 [Paracidovorax citrulli]MVT28742.1 hypothetical protein [Paracidovorax citrulli]MVT37397.1 hypothetical protein [Paracidovorax citrulli]PVY64112.1 hypothetical protein C8E08_1423 [Paracidovorax citrulli]